MTTRTASRPAAEPAPASALLDIPTVAQRLAVSERFVRRLVLERRIPFLKIGHFIRFDGTELERWIAETRVGVTPTGGRGSRTALAERPIRIR